MLSLKTALRFLVSRWLWTFLGLALLCALIWIYGPAVEVNGVAPLGSALARQVAIGTIAILWLFSHLLRQLRAARANRVFVAELARPQLAPAAKPGGAALARMDERFRAVLKAAGSGGKRRRVLREMPWYLMIGPPGTGKTTALRQSGLAFALDGDEDVQGVGGTRNCDWFFTDDAVLVDTAGRYTEQGSAAEEDSAEWLGFLDLLRRHRGRRALNGVVVAVSLRELLGSEDDLRRHGREVRRRLGEVRDRLGIHLPVYLMITKSDLLPGFEAFFGDLGAEDREQVWGATLPVDAPADAGWARRELHGLASRLEGRLGARLAEDRPLAARADAFRFPAQVLALSGPLGLFVDIAFGETRYDDASWLRGFYLSSATQEGSPIDRLVGELAGGYGLPVEPPRPARWAERRSFFLRRLFTDLIVREAGLGTLDPAAERRRAWTRRGALVGTALAGSLVLAAVVFSFDRARAALNDQAGQLVALRQRLAVVAAQTASAEPASLDLALAAMDQVAAAAVSAPSSVFTILGPRADDELAQAQRIAYEGALRRVLEPRMVAVVETAMRARIHDPANLLPALKVYRMLTGGASYRADVVATWWEGDLPLDPPPTSAALGHQLAAIERAAGDAAAERPRPDEDLLRDALASVCRLSLPHRAYAALLDEPAVADFDEWRPADVAGANVLQVLTRVSDQTLRDGIDGAFTRQGFHAAVLPGLPIVAGQAIEDRDVFAGGCAESADLTLEELQAEVLALYEQEAVDRWDTLLRDIRVAPLSDLRVATENMDDLGSPESALVKLLEGVADATDLARTDPAAEAGDAAATDRALAGVIKRLGRLGRAARTAERLAGGGGVTTAAGALPGQTVSDHFADLRALVLVPEGDPKEIEPVVTALGQLAGELRAVSVTPDPEATLAERGGLPTLTGAVLDAAAGLPPPIDDWVAGIARDAVAVTRDAVLDDLDAHYRADVLPRCRSAADGRYPFDEDAAAEVSLVDFQELFGPGGAFDVFTSERLAPHIDMSASPWAWRADYGLAPEALQPFERADGIREALFPGGGGAPQFTFVLEPKDLAPEASRVFLDVDGTPLAYGHGAAEPVQVSWPGPNRTGRVSLTFTSLADSLDAMTSETGAWALLRLLRKGRLSPTGVAEVFDLTLSHGGFWATFELRADRAENPLDLSIFRGFRCPEGF